VPIGAWFAVALVSASVLWAAQNFSATIRIGRDTHVPSLTPIVEQLSCGNEALRTRLAKERIATLEAKLARGRSELRSARTGLMIARLALMESLQDELE
jgi:hypothetical protein